MMYNTSETNETKSIGVKLKNFGPRGDRTHDLRVISTTL